MEEGQDKINRSEGTAAKDTTTKEPWQVTKEKFGKDFYIHGRLESRTEQIRKTGIILDGSFIQVRKPYDIQVALKFATANGTKPGVIFVARADSFKDIALIRDFYKDGGYPHIIEMSEHEGTPIPYIAEVPAAPDVDPHKHLVEKALRENQAVPPEVLVDYPDLQDKSKSYQPKIPKFSLPKLFR